MPTPFSIDTLREIYDEETKAVANWDLLTTALEMKRDARDADYLPYISKTMQYIKENIFHAETGDYYMLTYHPTGCYPRVLSKDLLENNLVINYLPPVVQKWWSTYAKLYQLCYDTSKERVFNEDGISYLNLSDKILVSTPALAPAPALENSTSPSVTEYFKNTAINSDEEEFNEHRTPKALYDLYAVFCENKKLSPVKYHRFCKELKGLSFLEVRSLRKHGKNATNYVRANRELCRAMYVEQGLITEEELQKQEEEEETNLQSIIPEGVSVPELAITEHQQNATENSNEESEQEDSSSNDEEEEEEEEQETYEIDMDEREPEKTIYSTNYIPHECDIFFNLE